MRGPRPVGAAVAMYSVVVARCSLPTNRRSGLFPRVAPRAALQTRRSDARSGVDVERQCRPPAPREPVGALAGLGGRQRQHGGTGTGDHGRDAGVAQRPPSVPRCGASPPPGSCWCSASSVAASSRSGRDRSASTSNAARPALRAASACGTVSGSSLRAALVDESSPGTKATGAIDGLTRRRDRAAPSPSVHAIVRPPRRHAATLSGWPSSDRGELEHAVVVEPLRAADDERRGRP